MAGTVAGCRHRSLAVGRPRERHYVSAAVAAVGIGLQAYGMFSAQGGGKLTGGQKAALDRAQYQEQQQQALQRMLMPYQLEAAGLEAELNPDGTVRSIKKRAPTPAEALDEQVRMEANQRVLKGLRGQLDIDPAATQQLNREQAQNEAYLRQTLGPDYKLSTAGQSGAAEFSAARAGVENAIRRGEMTAAEAIASSRANQDFRDRQATQGLLAGIPRGVPQGDRAAVLDEAAFMRGFQQDPRQAGYAATGSGLLKGAVAVYDFMRRNEDRSRPSWYRPSGLPGGGMQGTAMQEYRAGERPYYAYAATPAPGSFGVVQSDGYYVDPNAPAY